MSPRIKLFLLLLIPVAVAQAQYIPKFDLQGHRGARGIQPENTVPAFIIALNNGVTTLELDVVITHDKKVLVSHDPFMEAGICITPDSAHILPADKLKYNIYKMDYAEIQKFDCGLKPNLRFAEQQNIPATKPLLRDVIVAAEDHIKSYTRYEVDYNIEIKTEPRWDNKYHPSPEVFSDIVFQLIDQYLPWERVVIQSFDFRVLKYWHKKYPHVRLAALVETSKPVDATLRALGFTPSVYSPYFKMLKSQSTVEAIRKKKMRVIPWTVNEPADMKRLKAWGVDGIITDYPNRAAELGMGLKRK